MRALRRSISSFPKVDSQHPQLRAFFGLGRRRDTPQTAQGLGSETSSPAGRQSQPLSQALNSGSECAICRSESVDGEMTLKVPTESCTHPPQVCIGCLQQVILAAVTSGDFITGIPCPSYDCPQRLHYHDIKKWAAQEVFARYDKLLLQDSLRTDGRYVFCVEPSCTAGQEHAGGENNNIVTCHHCGTKQCFRHRVPWHDGLTCEQWDEQQRTIAKQQEKKTETWIQKGTKPCPGPGCGKRIQKSEGCDHMTCKRPGGCGHQFCWECLAPWLQIISSDNSKHYDNCRYYSGRPGKNPAPPEVVAARSVSTPPQTPSPPPPPPPTPILPEVSNTGSRPAPQVPNVGPISDLTTSNRERPETFTMAQAYRIEKAMRSVSAPPVAPITIIPEVSSLVPRSVPQVPNAAPILNPTLSNHERPKSFTYYDRVSVPRPVYRVQYHPTTVHPAPHLTQRYHYRKAAQAYQTQLVEREQANRSRRGKGRQVHFSDGPPEIINT